MEEFDCSDSERGGTSSVTLIDTDIEARVGNLKKQDIRSTATTENSRIAAVTDPDGNQIVFAQSINEEASNERRFVA